MTIRYPNGKKFQKKLTQPPIHLAEQKKEQLTNRRQQFEEEINQTNDFD